MAMTPQQEAQYALDFGVARSDLSMPAQLEYDRLVPAHVQSSQERREELRRAKDEDTRRRRETRWFPELGVAVYDGSVYRHGTDRTGRASSRQVYLDRRGAEMPLLGSLAGARAEIVVGKTGSRRSGGERALDAAAGVILTGGALGLLAAASRAGTGVAMIVFADGTTGPAKLLADKHELATAQTEAVRFNAMAGAVAASADSDLDRLKRELEHASAQTGVASELERLAKLHEAGLLDDEEFRAAKKRVIG